MATPIDFASSKFQYYDPSLCSLMIHNEGNITFQVVKISRKDNRIKADYFTSPGQGNTIKEKYDDFKRSHPNIVAYSSAAYMNIVGLKYAPDGISIDHGNVVNRDLVIDRLDALVVVYHNGGIAVNNLATDAVVTDEGTFKVRSSAYEKDLFITWAQKNRATVFQTHLLAEKNQLRIRSNSNVSANRRFLLASKDKTTGAIYHYIIQNDGSTQFNLYDGAFEAFQFFKKRGISVEWMINLDTGMQDTFGFFTSDGQPHPQIKGDFDMSEARSLLIYYFE